MPEHEFNEQIQWVTHDLGVPRIYASGPIEAGDAAKLTTLIKEAGVDSGVVLFDSPGGSLSEGVLLGEAIRKHGLSTGIAGFEAGAMKREGLCASACAYAFVGGVQRYYEAGVQKLGVHQFYASTDSEDISSSEAQKISGLLVAYLKGMGVDPLAFTVSASASPDGMFWLSTEQAMELQIATNGRSAPKAELKQAQGETYLSVEQDNGGALGRFLFFCTKQQIVLSGGYVTTPEDTVNKKEWATWSALRVGDRSVYRLRTSEVPGSLRQAGSMLFAARDLSRNDLQVLLKEKVVGMTFGGDGMVAYGTTADLEPVIDKVEAFIFNCTSSVTEAR